MTRRGAIAFFVVALLAGATLAGAAIYDNTSAPAHASAAGKSDLQLSQDDLVPPHATQAPLNEPAQAVAPLQPSVAAHALGPVPIAIPDGPVAPVYSRLATTDPVVFFTIDDGLVRDPAVVAFIKSHRLPVTLFPVKVPVHDDQAYFDQFRALGASIQDHTVTHPDLRTLSETALHKEICTPADDYAARFGTRPWLFRPPFGFLDNRVKYMVRACGLRAIVLWAGTMNDGRLDVTGGKLQAGDIILMHFRTDLLQNLKVLTDAAKAAHLTPAPLESYLPPG
jgi:peptidoglycan/xylan/chitin deacetylase (PgdA/CDA1 family)